MRKHTVKTFFIILLSLGTSAQAVTGEYEKLFKNSMSSKRLKYQNFGVSLLKKKNGKWAPAIEHNLNKAFTPASISKVLTATALLKSLGTGNKIETQLFSSAKPKGAVLESNLYVKGNGDPTLVSEKLWLLVNEVKKWGITKIKGNVIFDDTAFDQNILDGDRTAWNQRAYNAPITALSLNWNAVRVRFLNADPLRVVTDPFNPYFDLRIKKNLKKNSQVDVRDYKNKEVVSVYYGKDAVSEEKSIYRRVFNPRKVFENQFIQTLREAGITVTGKAVWTKTPSNLVEIGKIESASLSRLINLMMKHSNNFIADMLTKYLFNQKTQKVGEYKGGVDLLKKEFTKVSPFQDTLVFKSASGLSRDNKITPGDFSKTLQALIHEPYFPELLSSFPLSCTDGTLKKRICKKKGLVRAKTGLLAGVSALAGYAKSENSKDEYLFTFVYNGRNSEQFDAKKTFDSFLERIL